MPPSEPSPVVMSTADAPSRGAAQPRPYGARRMTIVWGLLVLLLVLSASRLLATAWWRGDLETIRSPLHYQAATLAFDYARMGAVRRGLGATLATSLADNRMLAAALFHLLATTALATSVTWLLMHTSGPWARRAVFLAAAVAVMMLWGEEPARPELLVAALLGAAALAMQRRRPDWAAACIGLGLFVHETSIIFGVPLLAALAWRCGAWPSTDVWRAAWPP